jgi:hypothetical protein
MSSVAIKFGPPPCPVPISILSLGQLAVAIAILMIVRPPFVCKNDQVNLTMVMTVAVSVTLGALLAHKNKSSTFEIFRAALETVYKATTQL